MIIRWTEKAFFSLEQISHHIADDNREAATRTIQSIYERIEELVTFPNRGRMGRREGTRELVLAPLPYIVVYRVKGIHHRNPADSPRRAGLAIAWQGSASGPSENAGETSQAIAIHAANSSAITDVRNGRDLVCCRCARVAIRMISAST